MSDSDEHNAFDLTWHNYMPSWRQLFPCFWFVPQQQTIYLDGEEGSLLLDSDARAHWDGDVPEDIPRQSWQRRSSRRNSAGRRRRSHRKSDTPSPYLMDDTDGSFVIPAPEASDRQEYMKSRLTCFMTQYRADLVDDGYHDEEESAGSAIQSACQPRVSPKTGFYAARALPGVLAEEGDTLTDYAAEPCFLHETIDDDVEDDAIAEAMRHLTGGAIQEEEEVDHAQRATELAPLEPPINSRRRKEIAASSYFRRFSRLSEFRMPIAGGQFDAEEHPFSFFSSTLGEETEDLEVEDDSLAHSVWNAGRKLWG